MPAGIRTLASMLAIVAPAAAIAWVAYAHMADLTWLMSELLWHAGS